MIHSDFLFDVSILLLRLVIAIVFITSGVSHVKNVDERSKSIGLSKPATFTLGIAEILGAVLIAIGIYVQIGSAILMLAMLGAMYKKIFIWNTKFFDDKGIGWHYDLLLFVGLLVILASNGGTYIF